ncbi:unnamed protein product [Ranitomeya imitator]|uniref:RRM domain-containing protein n=1 Tax=Ranitomeya imitator TaxID=111125 RepID=A0ABN9LLH2_9NEOB|nr:unnamed protein product [Ranitomeya imitator]
MMNSVLSMFSFRKRAEKKAKIADTVWDCGKYDEILDRAKSVMPRDEDLQQKGMVYSVIGRRQVQEKDRVVYRFLLAISYSTSQPSTYDQSSYSQPSSYTQQSSYGQPSSYTPQSSYGQAGSYGQQSGYGQQSSYQQQQQQQQPPPTSYPPPTSSYGSQPPSQYGQQSSGYGQQSSYRQDHSSSKGPYGQESRQGYSGSEGRNSGGSDSRGRGRGMFDRGGMSRGGRGGRGGMGSGGERAGFSKPGGLLDDGPELDFMPPMEPEEEPENNTIFLQGLSDEVTVEDIVDFFKDCGDVKGRLILSRFRSLQNNNRRERGVSPPRTPSCGVGHHAWADF